MIKNNLVLQFLPNSWQIFAIYTTILISFPKSIMAQGLNNDSSEIQFFDYQYGQNNLNIFNGVRFYDLYGSTLEHYRYFNDYKSYKGSIVYNGQLYPNIYMRYDLVEGNLIIYSDEKSSFFQIKLANEKVSSFTLFDLNFKKEDLSKSFDYGKDAFYEVSYSGHFLTLMIARSKVPEPKKSNERVYYIFKTKEDFFIKHHNTYIHIENAGDFKKEFPDQKKDIAQFYKDYRKLRKTNYKNFIQNLTVLLDRLIEL